MSTMGELIAEHMAEVRRLVEEVDPDPAWFEAPCPACGRVVWWQSVGTGKGRSYLHEIHCNCTEPAA